MKANHNMRSFTHVPQEKKQLNLITETIKGKDFMFYLVVISIPQLQLCYRLEAMKVSQDGVSQ